MRETPFFSIVTPVYNCEKYIEECILSIKEQDYQNYEHIIVDGGSTDRTMDIIKSYAGSYPMRFISEEDHGMYDAVNKGFSIAEGKVFSWLNADDRYMPWTLRVAKKAFERKNVQWITGIPAVNLTWEGREIQYIMTDSPFVYSKHYLRKGYYEGRILGFIQQESTFWTKQIWDKAGGKIPEKYQYAGDYFLWMNLAKYEPLYTVNTILANFRVHEEQKTAQMENYYTEIGKKTWKYKLLRKPLLLSLRFYDIMYRKKRLIDVRTII